MRASGREEGAQERRGSSRRERSATLCRHTHAHGDDELWTREVSSWILVRSNVGTSAAHPAYLGARKHTNNTAELTALAELLRALLSSSPQRAGSRGIVRTDSEYAAACIIFKILCKILFFNVFVALVAAQSKKKILQQNSLAQHWARDWRALTNTGTPRKEISWVAENGSSDA